ncbi:polymer-forming cytoskeletal protein [bacterium]|nr:polymer-forming cytoskeletal protein [bacterium]
MIKTRKIFIFFILIICLFVFPFLVSAGEIKNRKNITVEKGEVINENLYAFGENIVIKGKVEGDLIAFGENIKIEGEIEGDFIGAGLNIEINGTIKGGVKVVGESITINGIVEKNIYAVGPYLKTTKDSKTNWSLLFAGAEANLEGEIGRNLNMIGSRLVINNKIGKDAKIRLDKREGLIPKALIVEDGADISGNIFYKAGEDGLVSETAKIKGNLGYSKYKNEKKNFNSWWWKFFISTFSALFIGLVLISIMKGETLKIIASIKEKPLTTLGKGTLIMFLTPIVCIVLLFTIIGIPISLILLLSYIIIIIVTRVFVGILIGKLILQKLKIKKTSLMKEMVVGVILLWFIFSLPEIGFMFSLIALWLGLGAIWNLIQKKV